MGGGGLLGFGYVDLIFMIFCFLINYIIYFLVVDYINCIFLGFFFLNREFFFLKVYCEMLFVLKNE